MFISIFLNHSLPAPIYIPTLETAPNQCIKNILMFIYKDCFVFHDIDFLYLFNLLPTNGLLGGFSFLLLQVRLWTLFTLYCIYVWKDVQLKEWYLYAENYD